MYQVNSAGDPIWENDGRGGHRPALTRCHCQQEGDRERKKKRLEAADGLKPEERAISFDSFKIVKPNADGFTAVRKVIAEGAGIVTLTGEPGRGKTMLLMCAVNHARESGKLAIYTTMTDLLDYLRGAFDPSTGESFQDRWSLLLSTDVLALDELDEFNSTPWAMERFLRLVDERYRSLREKVTICATNLSPEDLVGKVASRLGDSRVTVVNMGGPDMRKTRRA